MKIPVERIERHIFLIRGQKVMLDVNLADLYGVEAKQLKRQVRRNEDRFPADFVGLAEDLTAANPTAGHPDAEGEGMMVAAGVRVAPVAVFAQWRSAELSGANHQRRFEQAPLLEIFQ